MPEETLDALKRLIVQRHIEQKPFLKDQFETMLKLDSMTEETRSTLKRFANDLQKRTGAGERDYFKRFEGKAYLWLKRTPKRESPNLIMIVWTVLDKDEKPLEITETETLMNARIMTTTYNYKDVTPQQIGYDQNKIAKLILAVTTANMPQRDNRTGELRLF
jgi:hypothetical protein